MLTPATKTAQAVKPKLGFLGVGWIGRNRLEAISKCGKSSIVAICDASEKSALQAAGDIENCKVISTYHELINSDVDGVIIATPSAKHAEQVRIALQHGKAVFVQKPLALDAASSRELVALAQKHNCLLKVDFSYRYTHAMKAVKQVIDSGEIGEIFSADLIFHNAYGPDKEWYYDVTKSGGGCLTDLGIHLIDLLYWLQPDACVASHFCRLYKNGQPISGGDKVVEDFAVADLTLNNALNAHIACSWNLNAGKEAVIEASFYGTKGGVQFKNINGSFYNFEANLLKGTETIPLENSSDDWGGRAGVEWAEQLSRGNSFDPTNTEYINVAETLDLLYGNP